MMSSDSRKRARAVAGLTAFAQYSMPVPSGNGDSQPPARHHVEHGVLLGQPVRVARSSGGVPNTLTLPFVWGMSAAAVRFGAGFMRVLRVVVLVEHDAVVAELVGQHHLGQVAVVQLAARACGS